jgi:hypothetical protein
VSSAVGRRRAPSVVLGGAAVTLLALESATAVAARPQQLLGGLALVVAPGLAVLPLLPPQLRRLPAAAPVIPLVGVMVAEVLLVSIAALGAPLDDVGIRVALWAVVLIAIAGSAVRSEPASRESARTNLSVLAGLAAIVGLGVWLQSFVIGGKPLPGEDWGEYLLYAQEIHRHHSLLIDNPYWMLGGQSFPLDPGVPSLYGAFLTLANAPATALLHGIWLFAVLAILAVFVLAATLWGSVAGLVAAGVYSALPMTLDMLAWHGLPNVAAFAVLPIAILATAVCLRGDGTRRWAAVLALALVSLAATHRFSASLGLVAIVVSGAAALALRPRPTVRFAAWTAVRCVLLGFAVAIDLVRRNRALGGIQSYEAFLPTKVHWDLVARDISWPIVIAGLAALAVVTVLRPFRADASRLTLAGTAVAIVALSYAWVIHLPTGYSRAPYFAPLVLAPALGLFASRMRAPLAIAGATILVAVVAVRAHDLGPGFRGFYGHVNEASLRGLGLVSQRARPHDGVVTDQCWSFLSTWLLQRPVLAALDPALILPKREVAPAARATRILASRRGAQLAHKAGIRFALVDPQCRYQTGERFKSPRSGRLVFASTRLLVFDFGRGSVSSRIGRPSASGSRRR